MVQGFYLCFWVFKCQSVTFGLRGENFDKNSEKFLRVLAKHRFQVSSELQLIT